MDSINKVIPSAAIKPVKPVNKDPKNTNKRVVKPELQDNVVDSDEAVKHIDERV